MGRVGWWIVFVVIMVGQALIAVAMAANESYAALAFVAMASVVIGALWGAMGEKHVFKSQPRGSSDNKGRWHYEAYPSEGGVRNYKMDVYRGDTLIRSRSFDVWVLRGLTARLIRFRAWRQTRRAQRRETRTF